MDKLPKGRTVPIDGDMLRTLRVQMDMSVGQLARAAKLSTDRIEEIEKNGTDKVFTNNFMRMAKALGLGDAWTTLLAKPPMPSVPAVTSQQTATHFDLSVDVRGSLPCPELAAHVVALTKEFVGKLAVLGVGVSSHQTKLALEEVVDGDLKRTIVLIYGQLENSQTPFWVFAAVKPAKYHLFMHAHKEGRLDIYNFNDFGEIIVSGEGTTPPDEVTVKVAEMYNTSPSTLTSAIQNDPPPRTLA